jgi:hypothetical protein
LAVPVPAEVVLENDWIYLNARSSTALLGSPDSPPVNVLSLLGEACDRALARQDFKSPDDLSSALQPCYHAMTWIECRIDANVAAYGEVCPSAEEIPAWANRFQAVNQQWLAMNGQPDLYALSFAMGRLQGSKSAGVAAGAESLLAAILALSPVLDFRLATYFAAFDVTTFGGVDLAAYVKDYAKVLHYELQGSYIASTAAWLHSDRALDQKALVSIASRLRGDPKISVGDKLYVDELLYGFDAL